MKRRQAHVTYYDMKMSCNGFFVSIAVTMRMMNAVQTLRQLRVFLKLSQNGVARSGVQIYCLF